MKQLLSLLRRIASAAVLYRNAQPIFFLLLSLGLGVIGVQSSLGAPNTFSATGSLATGRANHTATLLPNGKVLVAGGSGSTASSLDSAELYDPATGSWSATGSLALARAGHTATLLSNGKVLVAGGNNFTNFIIDSAELYDPATGSWSATGSLATARESHTATLLPNGKVLVAGGHNSSTGYLASAELYDTATGSWSATGSLPTARALHTATLLPSGKVLVASGLGPSGDEIASAELYDPTTGSWSTTGSLATARFVYTATLLPNGKVLVAGGLFLIGSGFPDLLASAELYDPATGSWSTTGSLATARAVHTATLLPNGKVLVAGGFTADPDYSDLASAELYDPTTGSWSATGSLATGRSHHTATLLPNGKVLAAGGRNSSTGPLASAELYDTATPPSQLQNISTRLRVLTGDNVLIGGFIITGTDPKGVIIRGLGPSVPVSGALADPTLELHKPDGSVVTNDNWKDTQQAEIEATGIPPTNDLESAIVATLAPGAYTTILQGKSATTGVGLVEVYDRGQSAQSEFANISTRGFVDTGDNVMIGGFIVGPADTLTDILVRAIGPSLNPFGISNPLLDPILELHDGNGALLTTNDNWKDTQQAEIEATGIPPSDDRESAILQSLGPGNYTAIVRGVNDTTGVGLVEVYNLQ